MLDFNERGRGMETGEMSSFRPVARYRMKGHESNKDIKDEVRV
jgi:hypothetical protein